MPDEHIINPWLTEQIRLYKAAHADAELREAYYRLRETEPDRTWFGFLIDSSVQAAIRENPFLGRKFIDTDLPGHTVDILLAHEIDSVAFLMQVSLQELSSLAGVTEADVRAFEQRPLQQAAARAGLEEVGGEVVLVFIDGVFSVFHHQKNFRISSRGFLAGRWGSAAR